jgi:hypothetical protein
VAGWSDQRGSCTCVRLRSFRTPSVIHHNYQRQLGCYNRRIFPSINMKTARLYRHTRCYYLIVKPKEGVELLASRGSKFPPKYCLVSLLCSPSRPPRIQAISFLSKENRPEPTNKPTKSTFSNLIQDVLSGRGKQQQQQQQKE